MNDRFKFRVWDIEDCSYFEPRDFDDIWLNENAELRVGFYSDATQMIEDYTDNVIIEQCTGLKDKNGNLIYEGDIIRYCVNWRAYCLTYTRVVAWDKNTAGFIMINGKTQVKPLQKWRFPDPETHIIEIVGNIHEQAEQKEQQ